MKKMNLQVFGDPTMADNAKFERQWLLHYIDSSFGGSATYVRIGKDLEDYAVEMNPDSETVKNIWGETSITVKGYEPQGSVETYYARKGDALYEKLAAIINNRSTGSALETNIVDILVESDGKQVWAYKENVIVIPKSIGGGVGGVNIPFEIHYNGTRVAGTWDNMKKSFTPKLAE